MSSVQESSPLVSFIRRHFVTAASIAATAFLGYCLYFDRKRRSAPDYKQKIRENRRAAAKAKGLHNTDTSRPLPNLRNPTEVQAFFLQQVQLGEELMSSGNIEEGAEHICRAITICGQPQQLLQIFQQTLPPEHYALIAQKLPEARKRLMKMFEKAFEGGDGGAEDTITAAASGMIDEEVE